MDKHPVIIKTFNTTVIKKYPAFCIVQDQLTGESTPVLPVQAVILSLCQGILTKDEIGKGISDIYKCGVETASWLIEDTITRCEKHLNISGVKELFQTPFILNPMDYLYKEQEMPVGSSLSEPYEAILLISERCNLQCQYCFRGGGHNVRDISTDDWIKIINDMGSIKINRCMVSGGEPTLHPGIVSIIDALLKNDIFPYLATNGTLLTPQMVNDLKHVGLKYTQVSLDTVNDELFSHITGANCLEPVMTGIKTLVNAGIATGVKAVITNYNAPDIINLIDFCHHVGVSRVTFDLYSPSYMGGKNTKLFLMQEQHESLVKTILEQREKYKGKMDISPYKRIPRWKNADSIIQCGAFLGSLTINAEGETIVCDQFDDSRLRPGNVLKNSIMDVWNSENMKRVRELKNIEIDATCKSCEYFDKCKTGCFSITQLYTGNPFAPDPRCWKAIIKGPDAVYE